MRRASSSQGGGGKRLRLDNNEKTLGKIESISLQNFMCHDNFTFQFGPRMNFIIGQNGSGKSAILTGLILALGGKSKATGRYSNIKGFIKTGKQKAKIEVVLHNIGNFAYKPETYGDTITVAREFTVDGSNTYKLKASSGRIVSLKKEELENVLNAMDIQIENPVQIFTQETSRNFLVSKHATGENLYEIFHKGTGLQRLQSQYHEVKQNKTEALQQLERKSQALPAMWKELEQLNKYLSSAKKITQYKNELLWASIISMEKQLEEKHTEFKKVENLIQINKDEIEKCKAVLKAKEKEFTECSKKRDDCSTSMTDLRSKLETIKANKEKVKMEVHKYQTHLDLHKKEKRKITQEIDSIEHRIRENRQKTQTDIEQEESERSERKNQLEQQIREIVNKLEILEKERQSKEEQGKQADQKMDNLNAELNDYKYRRQKTEDNINRIKMALKNKVNVFGQNTQSILNEISARRREFKQIPRGPIGKYVEVRDPQWIPAVEKCVGKSLLCSYCVDNQDDNRLLKSILKKHCNKWLPTTIVCKFSDAVYDVSQHKAHYSPTVLDMLNITDVQVANALIDHAKIENKILIEDTKTGQNLMLSNPPRNCSSAYLKNCDQICLGPYRYYSEFHPNANCLLSSVQQTDINQLEQNLDDLKARIQSKEREIAEFHRFKETIPVEEKKLYQQIRRFKGMVLENREKLKDCEVVHQPENVDSLEDDLTSLKTDYDNILIKIKHSEEQVLEHRSEFEKLDEEEREHRDLLYGSKEKYAELSQILQNCSHEKEVLVTGKDGYEKEAERNERLLQTLERDLALSREKTTEATEKAARMCPRVETTRDIAEIERQIEETSKVVESQRFAKGGRNEALKKYEEKANQYKEAKAKLNEIEINIQKLGEMLKERNAKFKELSAFTRKIIQLSFASILSGNGYTGNISFNVPKELLTLEVAPKSGQSARKNHSTLSGGERSYVSLSFLLALWERTHMPFRVLDEYDVFMDSNNRQLSVDLLISKAKEMEDTQFIFLSPLDLPAMDWPKDCVKIHKMIPPKRKDS